jgi:hypothetical protein
MSFKETSPYRPPSGFELASLEDEAPEASQLFEKSNLEGKQIWYMTAPASVPISSIQKTSLAEITNGNAILSHNGNDYSFIQDSSEDITYTKVMVPKSSDDGYRVGNYTVAIVDKGVTKGFKVQNLLIVSYIYNRWYTFPPFTMPMRNRLQALLLQGPLSQPKNLFVNNLQD